MRQCKTMGKINSPSKPTDLQHCSKRKPLCMLENSFKSKSVTAVKNTSLCFRKNNLRSRLCHQRVARFKLLCIPCCRLTLRSLEIELNLRANILDQSLSFYDQSDKNQLKT